MGNLVGFVFVVMFYSWGGGSLLLVDISIVYFVVLVKIIVLVMVFFFKGVLCNWLVCLVIWMVLCIEGVVKFIVIWWCLLVFIVFGYEYFIVNMMLFVFFWFGNYSEVYMLVGIGYNLLWVMLGNILLGVVFMGLGYWYVMLKVNCLVVDKFN